MPVLQTYTMEGELTSNMASKHAGVIPRSVHTIFDVLEHQALEYSVKVSFLELYNEELTDLLAEEESGAGGGGGAGMSDEAHKELRIFEDTTGKRGMLVNNLEEVIVTSSAEVFALLQRSWQKRRTAETLLNKNSSRSHCVFIITVHTKECDEDGEDIIKTGKLYLVDLAGSECVGKSGAQNQRAKEAGKINQSLLTLGRVINALVDKASYVPYRDSKLTRLLQESLGGRAKTVIIATVSPSMLALDETLSTLEYAHRAKNIRNRPQVNQKMSKRAYMKDLLAEISSLKRDNEALRLKNGVFLPPDKYELMMSQQKGDSLRLEELFFAVKSKETEVEQLQAAAQEKEAQLLQLTADKAHTQARLQTTQDTLASTELQLHSTAQQLHTTSNTLQLTSQQLQEEQVKVEEGVVLLQAHQRTEEALTAQAVQLVQAMDTAMGDKERLFDKVQRKADLEAANVREVERLTHTVDRQVRAFDDDASSFSSTFAEQRQRTAVCVERVERGSRKALAAVQAEVGQWSSAWSVQQEEMRVKQSAYHEATQRHLQEHAREVERAHADVQAALSSADEHAQRGSAQLHSRLQAQAEHFSATVEGRTQHLTSTGQSISAFAGSTSAALLRLSESTSSGLGSSVSSAQASLSFLSSFLQAQDEQRQRLRCSLLATVQHALEEAEAQQKQAVSSAVAELQRQLRTQADSDAQLSRSLLEDNQAVQLQLSSWAEQQRRSMEEEEAELDSATASWSELAASAASQAAALSSGFSSSLSLVQGQCELEAERGRRCGSDWFDSLTSFHADASQHSEHLQQLQRTFTRALDATAQQAAVAEQAELAQLSSGLQSLQSTASGFVQFVTQHAAAVQSAVRAFQSDAFQVERPSGRTPEKRKLPYPAAAALSSTPPHPQLLQLFRANKKTRRSSHYSSSAQPSSHAPHALDAAADAEQEQQQQRLSPSSTAGDAAQPSTCSSASRASAGQSQSPPLPLPSHFRHLSASTLPVRDSASALPSASSAIPVLSLRSAPSRQSAAAAPQHSSAVHVGSENCPPPPPAAPAAESAALHALAVSKAATAPASSFIPALSKPTLRSASRIRFGPAQPPPAAQLQLMDATREQQPPA